METFEKLLLIGVLISLSVSIGCYVMLIRGVLNINKLEERIDNHKDKGLYTEGIWGKLFNEVKVNNEFTFPKAWELLKTELEAEKVKNKCLTAELEYKQEILDKVDLNPLRTIKQLEKENKELKEKVENVKESCRQWNRSNEILERDNEYLKREVEGYRSSIKIYKDLLNQQPQKESCDKKYDCMDVEGLDIVDKLIMFDDKPFSGNVEIDRGKLTQINKRIFRNE